MIGVDVNTISRWDRGLSWPQPAQRRRAADVYQVDVALLAPPQARRPPTPSPLAFLEEPAISPTDRRVTESRAQWQRTRAALNTYRAQLGETAATIYGDRLRVEGTTLLSRPEWLPDMPVDLADIDLEFVDAPPPNFDGSEPETAHVRPLAEVARPFARYTQAIQDIARPRLFQNRWSWRPLHLDFTTARPRLRFGETTYFETMNTHEALAHETAHIALDADGHPTPRPPAMRALPFRRLIGDPFDLTRRPSISSVSTLVIRAGSQPSFLLHRRDSTAVAIAGSMIHVIPTGVFQPSSVLPAAVRDDFDLWRNLQRELSEELLGNDEHDGNGHPVDYTAEPFAWLDAARAAGSMRASLLGVGLDSLTLAVEILTTLVVDPDVFDDLACDFVSTNDEGSLVAERVPFDEVTVKGILQSGRMAPAAAGLLALAWRHREALLG